MRKVECLAMLLAGGQGSRLGALTKKIAKPAVPFGGKYRIIDFPLSNCHNSGIYTVGVLTQYQPLELHNYIGSGTAWDLDRKDGGAYILSPYAQEKGAEWYKGTADAIYQNTNFIDMIDPEYVLILSGDHIYRMDYSAMLQFHTYNNADATISVIEVPWEEAPRFGIMNTDTNNRITEFQEKPAEPISNLASMGIYVFNWKFLKKHLLEDAGNCESTHDFGKDVIPKILAEGSRLYAYEFSGYWKDVGTIESYWEANMDLLQDETEFDLHDKSWRIYSVNPSQPPQYISPEANVTCSLISEGASVYGEVRNTVIFPGAYIGKGARVVDSVILPSVTVQDNAIVECAILGNKCTIGKNAVIKGKSGKITLVTSDTMASQ